MSVVTLADISLDTALDIRQAVLWPHKPRAFSRVEGDDDALHLGALIDDHVVCVASLYNTETGARLRKFATLPAHQGKGIGSRMLQELINRASQSHDRFWMAARPEASGLYRRFGYTEFGKPFVKAGQDYIYMQRALP